MPRFFFHVHDHRDLPDREGTELPDLDAARVAAVQTAGEMLRDYSQDFWSGQEWTMRVTDETGTDVLTLTFTGTQHA